MRVKKTKEGWLFIPLTNEQEATLKKLIEFIGSIKGYQTIEGGLSTMPSPLHCDAPNMESAK